MRQRKLKNSWIFIAGIAVIFVLLIMMVLRIHNWTDQSGEGTASGKSALLALQEVSGDSYVESLANIREVKKQDDPLEYLISQSTVILDTEQIEMLVDSQKAGAESTALAAGLSYEELVVGEWGYESAEAYEEEWRIAYEEFITERLCVYEAARKMHVVIRKTEYQQLLPEYAQTFGYEDEASFTEECEPDSIAAEMLYDKVIRKLGGD